MRVTPLFALVILVITLSGCGSVVNSSVVSFHKMPGDVSMAKFSVVPYEDQEDSLEFSTYSARLSDKLTEYGWIETSVEDADFLVTLSYSIGDGQNVSGSFPIYGQTSGGTAYTTGSVNTSGGGSGTFSATTTTTPTFGQTGAIPYNVTQYPRTVIVEVISTDVSDSGVQEKIYEGRVTSRGTSSEIARVMPTFIEALFKDFPGKSGKSKNISMKLVED